MFTAALLITDKTWKQPRDSLEGKWTNNDVNECGTTRQWNIIQHKKQMNYQVIKKKWREFTYILLGQSSQSGKVTHE